MRREADSQDRHGFAREAMAAMFQITVVEPDPVYAGQAAAAALAQLERVEHRLSRYVETSDIFRINRLAPGQATTVHPDTFQCLRIALHVQAATGRAFDVAYASAVRPDDGPPIELIEPGCVVRVLAEGVELDLGAIGKGFALDRMAALLAEWDIATAPAFCQHEQRVGIGPAARRARLADPRRHGSRATALLACQSGDRRFRDRRPRRPHHRPPHRPAGGRKVSHLGHGAHGCRGRRLIHGLHGDGRP